MTQNIDQLLKIQSQMVYRPLDPTLNLPALKRVGMPHTVQTTVGTWIHIPIIQENQVFDPVNALTKTITIPKEHSIYVYNPYLNLQKGLDAIELKQFFKVPQNVPNKVPLARIHSSCRFGDTFGSQKCDCGPQLFAAKKAIVQNGFGFILYLEQQGRNIGLLLKAAVYRIIQVYNVGTHESFAPLKIKQNDLRSYQIAVDTFKIFGIQKVSLLTNNPKKFDLLLKNGIEVVQRQISIMATEHNRQYLLTKRVSMGHSLLDPQNDYSSVDSPTKIAQVVNRIHESINSQNVDKFEHALHLSAVQGNQQQQDAFAAFFNQRKHPKYFFLSNFYDQEPVQSPQEGVFRCSEGLYQYQKFKHLNDQKLKRQMQKFNGEEAFKMSRQLAHKVIVDWEDKKVDAMKLTLKNKFSNETLKQKLLATGTRYLVENCHKNFDSFWADNGDGTGKNMMGVLLMQLRQQFGGKGIVERSKVLQQFYLSKCNECQDPCIFTNKRQLRQKCAYHGGLLQN